MKDILSARKKVYHNTEVIRYKVPKYRELSLKRVIEMVKKHKQIMVYLPESKELTPKRMTREYMFGIISTCDP